MEADVSERYRKTMSKTYEMQWVECQWITWKTLMKAVQVFGDISIERILF